MNRRHPMAMVAAASVLLAAVPLTSLFTTLSWLLFAATGVVVVIGSAMLTRTARGPLWAQVLVMLAALLVFLTIAYPSGHELFRLIPTGATFEHFNDLLVLAGQQIRTQSVPVPDLDGLLFLATMGICLVAIVVDLVAVGLRRPALAGLPMLAIYSVPVAVLPDGVPVITFVFAAIGYLWLLVTDSVDRVRRFGRRFTGEGRDVDLWEPSPLAAAGRRLGLVGLVVAIILPIAIPGLSSGLMDAIRGSQVNDGTGNGTGTSGQVDLNAYLTNQLLVRDTIVPMVKVTTNDPDPYYLRFAVSDAINENGFVARPNTGTALSDIPPVGTPDVQGLSTTAYKANVQVLNTFTMPFAPMYTQLTAVRGLDNNWFYDNNANVVFARLGTSSEKQYSLEYVHVRYTTDALQSAPPLNAQQRSQVIVPEVAQITQLVNQLTEGRASEYERIRAIYDYFTQPSNNFTYSLQAPARKSGNAIADFLDAKKGFCVQYAASMAWLARVAGYPSRVAFGFARGTGPNTAGVYTLTNTNLHAWTEVYFPDFGWVPFDTTPSIGVVGSVQSVWAPDPLKPVGPSASATSSATPGPDDTDPGNIPHGDPGDPNAGGGSTQSTSVNPWLLAGAALIGVLLVLVVTPAMRRRALSRRRRARSGSMIEMDVGGGARPAGGAVGALVTDPAAVAAARRDAHAAWAELHDTMIDFRVDVDDAETPRTTAERIGAMLGEPTQRTDARLLARAEERARYAQLPLRADGLNEAVRSVRGAFALRATRWERFSAVVLPRSVLLRWRLAVINRIASIVAATARTRAALGAANPRRALSRAGR